MVDREWERRRAVLAFLELARDSLQAADAMLDVDESPLAGLKEQIYVARLASVKALDELPPLQAFKASPSSGKERP
jgi:hypothetical protein